MITDIGYTGSRQGMTIRQAAVLGLYLGQLVLAETTVHHGDCSGGDAEFHDICRAMKIDWIVGHPPANPALRAFRQCDELRDEMEYLKRDRVIVDESGVVFACPSTFKATPRSGTWYTINYALTRGVRCVVIFPDGTVR